MFRYKVLLCLSHVLGVLGATQDGNKQQQQPNIIFFLVDDMGWNDVGYHGLTQIPTPNIDALAANGIILEQYYSAPACSPSRASLLSGLYPSTNGMQHYVLQSVQATGLPLNNLTLPEYMAELGYQNHMVGKWHLGYHEKRFLPENRGFKSHYGFWVGDSDFFFHNSASSYNISRMTNVPLYDPTQDSVRFGGLSFRSGNRKVLNRQGQYLTDIYTNQSIKIIKNHSRKNKNEPLFLYLSHHGVHRGNFFLPVRGPRRFTDLFADTIADDTRRNFAGALTAIDVSLGKIMKALESSKMLNNTILVFASDNGSPPAATVTFNGGSNYPLRGAKTTAWEGAVRVNAFVWSPLFKNRGVVYDGLMHISDWLPTLYGIGGGNSSDLIGPLDGKDMYDAIQHNLTSPRDEILHLSDDVWNTTAYRKGDFKIIRGIAPGMNYDDYYGDAGRESPPFGLSTTESETADVLRKFYKTKDIPISPKVIDINCDDNPVKECKVETEYCLFNVKLDPCERTNLANDNPDLVEELVTHMEKIYKVDALNPPYDYKANPLYYAGYWSPWIDIDADVHTNESDY